mgnify:CR=1 FL=1
MNHSRSISSRLVLNANWEVISFFKSQFQNQNPQALSPKAPFLYYNSHDLLSVRRYSFFGLTRVIFLLYLISTKAYPKRLVEQEDEQHAPESKRFACIPFPKWCASCRLKPKKLKPKRQAPSLPRSRRRLS